MPVARQHARAARLEHAAGAQVERFCDKLGSQRLGERQRRMPVQLELAATAA
jgi:hypothetical protein